MDKAFAIRDLRYVINQDPVSVVFDGVAVNGSKSRMDAKAMAANAGLQTRYVFSVQTVAGDWVTGDPSTDHTPGNDAVVAVAGSEYRVLQVSRDSLGVGVRLDLGAKFQ